ncbi:MAG: flavin monoamine oxidase family protein [Acidimicrobiia bacterium]
MVAHVAVVGGGLAGLTAATALARAGVGVQVLEARSVVGGRMMTVVATEVNERAWLDLGATWHWDDQPRMQALARELGVESFPQYRTGQAMSDEGPDQPARPVDFPPSVPAELRFVGGAQDVCRRLADRLPEGSVELDTTVVAVEAGDTGVALNVIGPDGTGRDLEADAVVMALPPRLALDTVAFTPDLPEEVEDVLRHTPTWMATSLKCVAVYETAFWREAGLSGLAYSREGPLREVHDAGNDDGSLAALWGFISALHEFRDLDFDDRRELVFAQLGRLFGPDAADPLRYLERDWSGDPFTNDEVFWVPKELLAYGNPAFARPLFGGRLVWAGAETSDEGGGHMEGAVASGERAARLILDRT